jgi:hypothetical protein
MKDMKPVLPIILILVGLGVGFGGGYFFRNYQLTKMRGNFAAGGANGTFQRFNGAVGARGTGQNGMMRGGTSGSILSMDDKSITVKMPDGSTKIVFLSDTTKYSNTAVSTRNDLKTGENVAVFGTPNSDGSVTATSIQLNPMNFVPQDSPMFKGSSSPTLKN